MPSIWQTVIRAWLQVIIEKAYQGNKDHIRAALDLFVDFVAIFVSPFCCSGVCLGSCMPSFTVRYATNLMSRQCARCVHGCRCACWSSCCRTQSARRSAVTASAGEESVRTKGMRAGACGNIRQRLANAAQCAGAF